jgi:hypothetical protein
MKQASLFHHLTSVQFCSEGADSCDEGVVETAGRGDYATRVVLC